MADGIKKTHNVLKFRDNTRELERPILKLMKRSGDFIGIIQYENLNCSFIGNAVDEMTFDVRKYIDGKINPLWDEFKQESIRIVEYNNYGRFEASVTLNDKEDTIKSISCKSLEVELGQVILHEFHVNDEDDILRSDYETTYLYDKNNEKASLLNRAIKDKAPQWSIGHIDDMICVNGKVYPTNQYERFFTVDGTSIYDFFTNDIANECNVVFLFDTIKRIINMYNIYDAVYDKSNMKVLDGAYENNGMLYDKNGVQLSTTDYGYCPGIGKDTMIYIDKSQLANSFTIDNDLDSMKNCFYITGGDDTINNYVGAATMTGNNYIYLFQKFQYDDMPENLSKALMSYQAFYESKKEEYNGVGGVYVYDPECIYDASSKTCKKGYKIIENAVYKNGRVFVLDTKAYYENGNAYTKDDVKLESNEYYYSSAGGIYTQYNNLIDRLQYIQNIKFPEIKTADTTSENVAKSIKAYFAIPEHKVYLKNLWSTDSFTNVTSTVETMIGVKCDSRYSFSIEKSDTTPTCTYNDKEGTWSGKITVSPKVTVLNDTSYTVDVVVFLQQIDENIANELDLWNRQKLDIAVSKQDIANLDLTKYGTENELVNFFKQYNKESLSSYKTSFKSCLDTLAELYNNCKDLSEVYSQIKSQYELYYNSCSKVLNDVNVKIEKIESKINLLQSEISDFQKEVDIKAYLNKIDTSLYPIFRSYIREDEYNNSNYISDGKTDLECVQTASELVEVATDELKKACIIQKKVSGDLNNIFNANDFEKVRDNFSLFNYIRCRIDDKIYKLRLIQIDFDESDLTKINVTFSEDVVDVTNTASDIKSILSQVTSISTSYSSTVKKSKLGTTAYNEFDNIKREGLLSSKYVIANSSNEEVIYDSNGILCRSETDIGEYGEHQLRLNGNGIYLTDDAWDNVREAIGMIQYNGKWVYGLIADAIVGDLMITENLKVLNKNSSVIINKDGITLNGAAIKWTSPIDSSAVNGLDDKISDFVNSIGDLQSQIDGEITSWFENYDPTTNNEPASTWKTDSDKIKHEGDLFYNTATGGAFRYIYNSSSKKHEWTVITDEAVSKALADAAAAQDTADHKRRVFVDTPYVPYDVGDLWSQGDKGDLYRCKIAKTDKQKYSPNDWEKATKYTDDTAWKAWTSDTGEFGQYKDDIKNQIDGKSNCTYGGATPPHNPEKGDLWFCTDGSIGYGKDKAYMYDGATWQESNGVPDSVWDKVDGKSSIYVKKPTNGYKKNDLWILESDDILAGYTKGTVIVATSDSTRFNASHWVEKVKYTDDTKANAVDKELTKYKEEISDFQTQVDTQFSVAGVTQQGGNYIYSPKIASGYLYITKDGCSVQIDPARAYQSDNPKVINVQANNSDVFYVERDGSAYFKGDITSNNAHFNGSINGKGINFICYDETEEVLGERSCLIFESPNQLYDVSVGHVMAMDVKIRTRLDWEGLHIEQYQGGTYYQINIGVEGIDTNVPCTFNDNVTCSGYVKAKNGFHFSNDDLYFGVTSNNMICSSTNFNVKGALFVDGEVYGNGGTGFVKRLSANNIYNTWNPTGTMQTGLSLTVDGIYIGTFLTPNGLTSSGNWNLGYGSGSSNIATVQYVQSKTSSDERVKKNFSSLPIQIDKIFDSLYPQQYEFNDILEKDGIWFGDTSQHIQSVFKENGLDINDYAIVRDRKVNMFNGESNYIDAETDKYHYINQDNIIWMCVDQIQKLKNRVAELETKLQGEV